MEVGGRMASFRGISHCYQRPTYEDWPYSVFTMAHGRSKEECDAILDSIADDCGIGPATDRATLYSSTEYKKIRLHYFTDDYARWEAEHSLSHERSDASSTARARRGPARRGQLARCGRCGRSAATRSSSSAARAAELVDVDGNRYVDWVGSWGPLILGHAEPAVVAAVIEAAEARHQLRRRDRGRGRARRGGRRRGCPRSRWCG